MTPEETVRSVAGPVGRLGGAFMTDPATVERGRVLGLSGWSFYHCGRGGVLGEADADVVVAAFGFFPAPLVRKAWERGRAVRPVPQIAAEYAGCCAEWGRRVLADVPQAGRLAELLLHAAAAADVAGLPLFAGWRALVVRDPPPDDPALLALALQVMREHRGGSHLLAVVSLGVPPLQALVSGRYGPDNARFFGWPEPWPDPEAGRAAMAEAERLTDRLVQPAYAALPEAERAELVRGLRAVRV